MLSQLFAHIAVKAASPNFQAEIQKILLKQTRGWSQEKKCFCRGGWILEI